MNAATLSPYERVRRLALLIRQLRLGHNLSRSKVAKRGGIGPSTLNQLEHVLEGGPLVGMPTPDTLRAIARGLATNGLGRRDCALTRQIHSELMAAIGYSDPPPATVVSVPREVLEKLAQLSDADIELGLTGRPWTEADTAHILRTLNEALRRKHQRGQQDGNSHSA